MAELRPHPFPALVTRMLRDLERRDAIYDLPVRRWWLGDPERDLSVRFHGQRAATALGPAAGPQSQMAQNLVLSWLGGCRIMELKTVQVDDELVIPRPCIDMQTVGFNVEWSQELKLPQSLDEYVKGAMLIRMLAHEMGVSEEDAATVYDMSVGYDLEGIRADTVQAFIAGMRDPLQRVDAFRREIPSRFGHLRDLDYETTGFSNTLTLSTFHGCPPDEIESICRFLMEERGIHTVVKLNPMLLGPERAREILGDVLGYGDLRIPDSAFTRDTTWAQMVEFVGRLGDLADRLGVGFGVKFTNTLIVENHRTFFPASEREMYLSGAPLHVLAMVLVRRFRRAFGDRFPISFSAGIDSKNFADAVGLGLVPVTTCSDLLKPGGYGRAKGYLDELSRRMAAVGAADVDAFVQSSPDTEAYVAAALADPRYRADRNARPPRKIGSSLELFDCITCDKCVPVCPNDANFTLPVEPRDLPIKRLVRGADGWVEEDRGVFHLSEKHQIANFADFCNDCGNCDVFCPEDGGPYVLKPRFFGSMDDWHRFSHLDGFHIDEEATRGRVGGKEFLLDDDGFAGDGFRVGADGVVTADASIVVIDLLPRDILLVIREGARASGGWVARSS